MARRLTRCCAVISALFHEDVGAEGTPGTLRCKQVCPDRHGAEGSCRAQTRVSSEATEAKLQAAPAVRGSLRAGVPLSLFPSLALGTGLEKVFARESTAILKPGSVGV